MSLHFYEHTFNIVDMVNNLIIIFNCVIELHYTITSKYVAVLLNTIIEDLS